MKVSEIFYSIQAEAKGVGEPAVFVRLAKCNLNCDWCDSKYTLTEEYREIDVEKIVEQIKEHNCKNVVITGGEPLLQIGPLSYLVSLLSYGRYEITIETNGTIEPNEILLDRVQQWNISPKFGHLNYSVLKRFNDASENIIFKFVIENEGQVKEIQSIQEVIDIPDEYIYLMPCAKTRAGYLANAGTLIEFCKKYGYNFSPREHIVIWDNKRGV